MGMSASDLKALEDDAKAYDNALQHANLRPLTFNLRVAEDTYNDETRIKKSVNRQDLVFLTLQDLLHCTVYQSCKVNMSVVLCP